MEINEVDRNLDITKSVVTEYENKFRNKNMPIYFVRATFKEGDTK